MSLYHTDLVLLGGGHSHVAVLKKFGMQPLPGVRLTLVSRDAMTPYSGMLPGYIAGHYDYDTCHIDLRRLAQFAGACLIHAPVSGLDLKHNQLLFDQRPALRFDYLSINIGSTPPVNAVPGAAQYALAVKPIDQFVRRWQQLTQRICETDQSYHLLVAGAGAGGVELLLACQYQLQEVLKVPAQRLSWSLVTAAQMPLQGHNAKTQAIFEQILQARGIQIYRNSTVTAVGVDYVEINHQQTLASDIVFWVTGASAPGWLQSSALTTSKAGFMQVNACLQSVSHPHIFGAGDCADVVDFPRPKSGVFAVRQGLPLAANLRRAVTGQSLKPFKPQRQFLSLVSTGDQYAVASRSRWALAGKWLWYWKDYIDQAFMDRYKQLPAMEQTAMRCRGCAAKLSADLLGQILARLQLDVDNQPLIGLAQPDDAAVFSAPAGQQWVQSVDYFTALLDDPYLFGQIAAQHALNDLYAMAAQPHSALAIATLPQAAPALQEDTLYQLLSGVLTVLKPLKAQLIGGHSSEGAELAFGLTVNGTVKADKVWRKTGLQTGDQLILTKALGTGVIFAGNMQRQSQSAWVEHAINSMLQSNGLASQILQAHHASACTDVSGFGLAGHLLEMLRPAGLSAQLYLSDLPLLEGATTLTAQSIESTLTAANRQTLAGIMKPLEHAAYDLLFDPQTAGGLLAGVAPQNSDACLKKLQQAGYIAAIIGEVQTAPLAIRL